MNAERMAQKLAKPSAKEIGITQEKLDRAIAASTYVPETSCFLRTTNLTPERYPIWKISVNGKQHRRYIRRDALELQGVEIGPHDTVVDTCGNRACINPKHLKVGTLREKAIEVSKRGTRPGQKANEDMVRDIRKRAKGGEAIAHIAESVGLSHSAVKAIVHRRTFQWVTEEAV